MARNVLVTGSSHGIGAAVAIEFAKQGDNVGITYLKSPEGAKAVQAECLKYGVDAQIFQVDLSVRAECEKLMEEFLAHYGVIDVLINNAGGALQIPKGEFDDMPMISSAARISRKTMAVPWPRDTRYTMSKPSRPRIASMGSSNRVDCLKLLRNPWKNGRNTASSTSV
jgi:NAD(P)-dependent dehydrogenase (short-subunit alcohol dehydrogenase family)